MKDGRFVQVGTPEEVVAHPADDYVADFTKDVPRAHVLTARTIMRRSTARRSVDGRDGRRPTRSCRSCCRSSPTRTAGSAVVEGDAVVGVVDRAAVLAALIEERA